MIIYDWLKKLSIDEMADFLANVGDCNFCKRINGTHLPSCDRDCDINFRDWLCREADDEKYVMGSID